MQNRKISIRSAECGSGRLAAIVLVAAWLAAAGGVGAQAKELRIGLSTEPTSIDPLYQQGIPNFALAREIFDTLIEPDNHMHLRPGLALSWKPIDDTTWEIKLRPGVRFHDGSPFTAEDVLFSIDRASKVPNSPAPMAPFTKAIAKVTAIDKLTIHIKTKGPHPLLPQDLSVISIVSKHAAQGKTTSDFNSGAATVGTGPYKFVKYVPGDRIVLQRNDEYWGKKAAWTRVIERVMTNGASRVAALLAGDVDIIENVFPADIARLKKNDKVTVVKGVSNRLIILLMDSTRNRSPFVLGNNGKPLDKNPLKDARVRKAISMAINRQAIVDHVMAGAAEPARQLLPGGFFGLGHVKVPGYDPKGAKKLLAEAGYPRGFRLTLHGPNGRYVNDAKVEQAVAEMLSRVEIDTKVETLPWSVFASRATKREFSFFLNSLSMMTGEMSWPLKVLLATYDPGKGWGAGGRGTYSNPKLDAVLGEALRTLDTAKREKLLQEGSDIGMRDVGIIPLYFESATWAMRKGIDYLPNPQEFMIAQWATPAARGK